MAKVHLSCVRIHFCKFNDQKRKMAASQKNQFDQFLMATPAYTTSSSSWTLWKKNKNIKNIIKNITDQFLNSIKTF